MSSICQEPSFSSQPVVLPPCFVPRCPPWWRGHIPLLALECQNETKSLKRKKVDSRVFVDDGPPTGPYGGGPRGPEQQDARTTRTPRAAATEPSENFTRQTNTFFRLSCSSSSADSSESLRLGVTRQRAHVPERKASAGLQKPSRLRFKWSRVSSFLGLFFDRMGLE